MGNRQHRDWLQIIGMVGVIAGLVLVAFEVRQANKFAQAEAIRAMYESTDAILVESLSTDVNDIYLKAFEDPDGLSDVEILKLDTWLTVQLQQYDNRMVMQKLGLNPYDTIAVIEADFEYFFGNEFGRAWFWRNKHWMEQELSDAIEQQINNTPVSQSSDVVEDFRSRIRRADP